ncbi:MAG: Bd3614 family nucleic acid deaminase [Deltaproteobacteria bacterium]|nr:Bd3614 family nucleic acid deaminase [Deltaproteobacteria bacterium]
MLSLAHARALARGLTATQNDQIAFLESLGTVFYVRRAANAPALISSSVIVDLIQGIYEHDSSQALRRVRSRIYATVEATEMCRGMTMVTAKRLTAPLLPDAGPLPTGLSFVQLHPRATAATWATPPVAFAGDDATARTDGQYMSCALQLAATVPREKQRHECDRPIAALLVAATGEILSWGLNTNARNKTLHAEVNMVQAYCQRTGRGLPRGARIYSTLKPCRMCAGMIWHCAEDLTSLKVYYHEFDSGPHARETILNPLSQERRRLARPELLNLAPESQLAPT